METGQDLQYNRINVEGWGGYQCSDTPNPSNCSWRFRNCDTEYHYKSPPDYEPGDCDTDMYKICTISYSQDYCVQY